MAGMGYAVMGTAVRGGSNRAMEAAIAAMASPLLEDGAIDGARGILINITGSASLKLSEVNEASTLIQNAAHEDANIIFGAVLDENMGDEVKITVIATGFRQGSAERREQMLGAALREAQAPRIEARLATPRFASEEGDEEMAPVIAQPTQGPVLVPVSSREFVSAFRIHEAEPTSCEGNVPQELGYEEEEAELVGVAVAEHAAQPEGMEMAHPAFVEEPGENLDIPAFMRKGTL
jgi:cell division protein FtsZ